MGALELNGVLGGFLGNTRIAFFFHVGRFTISQHVMSERVPCKGNSSIIGYLTTNAVTHGCLVQRVTTPHFHSYSTRSQQTPQNQQESLSSLPSTSLPTPLLWLC